MRSLPLIPSIFRHVSFVVGGARAFGFLSYGKIGLLGTWVITHGMKMIFPLLCLYVGVWNVWRIGKMDRLEYTHLFRIKHDSPISFAFSR